MASTRFALGRVQKIDWRGRVVQSTLNHEDTALPNAVLRCIVLSFIQFAVE